MMAMMAMRSKKSRKKKRSNKYCNALIRALILNPPRPFRPSGPKKAKKGGFPGKPEVKTTYLEELAYDKGLSHKAISDLLYKQGFKFSHTAVRKRLMKGERYAPQKLAICKYKKCGKEFEPKGRRRVYCSRYCCLADNRMLKQLGKP